MNDAAVLDAEAAADEAAWCRRVSQPYPTTCPACEGRALGDDARPCRECAGTGEVLR